MSFGVTHVPIARHTTTGSGSTSAALGAMPRSRTLAITLRASKPDLPAGVADLDELAGRLDVVAGEDRREELDRLVGAEEPLVAVEADEQLGGDVAEEREHARAVDELAGVVRVVSAHPEADRDLRSDHDCLRTRVARWGEGQPSGVADVARRRQFARQTVSLHFGVAAGHSLSSLHWTHRASAQIGAAAPHSALVRQAAHFPRATSHLGVGAEHWVSLVHPGVRHSSSTGSQVGAAVPQSALERHVTQRPLAGEQRGLVAGQSLFTAHATQLFVVASQIGSPAPQSAAV